MTPLWLIRRASQYSEDAVTGDCGMFAFALAKLLGDPARLVFFVQGYDFPDGAIAPSLTELDQSEMYLRHVAVMWNGCVYDAEGEQTIEGIQDQYFSKDDDGFAVVYPVVEEAARTIRNHTNFSSDWGFYYQVMQPSNRTGGRQSFLAALRMTVGLLPVGTNRQHLHAGIASNVRAPRRGAPGTNFQQRTHLKEN